MKRFINIAFDLDDTLVEFAAAFEKVAADQFGAHPTETDSYSLMDIYGLDILQVHLCLDVLYTQSCLQPCRGARNLIVHLWHWTHDPISIITARPIESAQCTHDLIRRYLCRTPYTLSLPSGDDKGAMAKIPYILRFKYYVEDNPEVAWLLATQTNVKVFLIDKPYNKELNHGNITRIKDIRELLEMHPLEMFTTEGQHAY